MHINNKLISDVDQVYTITSLSGFEALLYGCNKVTVFGCPFYAGWGLTDDRQTNYRRTAKRTLEEVFLCAYMLYPMYFDPETGEKLDLENVINRIDERILTTKMVEVKDNYVTNDKKISSKMEENRDNKKTSELLLLEDGIDSNKSSKNASTTLSDKSSKTNHKKSERNTIDKKSNQSEGNQVMLVKKETTIKQDDKSVKKNLIKDYIYCFMFSKQKYAYVSALFKGYNVGFASKDYDSNQIKDYLEQIVLPKLHKGNSVKFYIWSVREPEIITKFAKNKQISVFRMEDGLLRSVGLGINHIPPYSLCLDSSGIYFDSTRPSDLENLIQNYNFQENSKVLERAKNFMNRFKIRRLSKYNLPSTKQCTGLYGIKKKKRVLVLSQNDGDASIEYGCAKKITCLELLKLAIRENPGAQIIYKAHPDLEFSDEVRKIRSEVSGDYQIIDGSISMYDCTEEVDQAYTITSLSGFEALLAGVPKVTTLGCPFYAGWGLTDDRQYNPRRTVKRTLEEVFACAYLLYPTYFDPASGKKLKAEEVADRIYKEKVKAYGKERQLYAPFPKLKEVKLPSCFDRRNSKEIQRVVDSDKKIILAISDGRAGDDIIFNKFSESVNIPLELLNIVTDDVAFEKAFIFAKQNPLLYKRYITNRLTPLISNIKMVLFTSDLNPFTRIVVEVCAELEIKTLLIVNEPRYISHETWYWDPESRVSIPQCEEVWVSTSFQKDIFIERGYPEDRIFVTPSPYIMSRVDYSIKISKKQFCRLYGFDPLKKIVLYSCVDFGLFVDSSLANRAQKDSLLAVINYCRDNDLQLLIRCNSKSLLQIYDDFSKIIEEQKCCEVESSDFAMNVIESICHADCVISADNEVLENAILMCRYAIALRFIHELKLPWDENYVRVAENVEELENSLRKLDSYELNMKKNADFKKIIVQDSGLFNILKNDSGITLNAFLNKPSLPSVFDKLLQRISLDVVLTGFPENQSSNRYLKYLLGTNTLLGKDHCTAPVCCVGPITFVQNTP